MKEKATERLGVRVTPTLKQRIEKRAEEESRTPSNFIINVLTQYIDEIDKAKEILKNK